MNLFICGNGFDIAHKVESEYFRFRKWLIEEYSIDESTLGDYLFTGYSTNYKNYESYDERAFAKLFVELIDNAELTRFGFDPEHKIDWNQFEDLLGEINWKKIDMNVENVLDNEGDIDPWKTGNNYAFIAHKILESCHILKNFFIDWIRQIDISKIKIIKKIEILFNSNEFIFLNFNYTKILEKIYGIKNVFHIHGDIDDYWNLKFGHSEEENLYFANEDEYMMMEANDYLKACHFEMEKPSKNIINKNTAFFDSLNCVDNIYFYGFGFGKSDLCYVEKIIKSCKKIENIYISNYQYVKEKKDIEKALESCGYSKKVLNIGC